MTSPTTTDPAPKATGRRRAGLARLLPRTRRTLPARPTPGTPSPRPRTSTSGSAPARSSPAST